MHGWRGSSLRAEERGNVCVVGEEGLACVSGSTHVAGREGKRGAGLRGSPQRRSEGKVVSKEGEWPACCSQMAEGGGYARGVACAGSGRAGAGMWRAIEERAEGRYVCAGMEERRVSEGEPRGSGEAQGQRGKGCV